MAVAQTTEARVEAQSVAELAVEKMFGGGEQPAVEHPEIPGEVATSEGEVSGQEPAVEHPDEVEVEIEGEKYLVPKKISDRFIQHADYTRKTQDVAEMRRALSAEREVTTLNKAFDQAVAPEQQRMILLDAQIEQYKRLDWQGMDTEQLLKARAGLDQLKDMRAEIDTSIKAKRGEFDQKISGHVQEAMQAGEKYIEQHIKDFNEKSKKQLFDYGVSEGYTRTEMDKLVDPRIVVSLWKAQQWDALLASKPGTMLRASQAAPVVRPGATIRQPSRIQALSKAIKVAKGSDAKKTAALDYFTAKFGG